MTEYSIGTSSDSTRTILLAIARGHTITLIYPSESLRKISLNINIPHGRFND